MRAAGLVCLGAGAGLIRGDLREVRGTDVACRSGGVVVTVRGARPRAVPVLARYHARLLAAASVRRDRADLRRGRSGPPEPDEPAGQRAGRRDGPAAAGHPRLRATWLADAAELLGLATFMHAAGITCSQRLGDLVAGLEPAGEAEAVRLLGAPPAMIPLAAFEEIIDASGAAPRIEAMLPIGVRARQLKVRTLLAGHVPGPGRRAACPPDPRSPGADQPAGGRPAAARRARGLEARPAPADLPAGRVHLRPRRRRPRQGRAGRAVLRPAAGHLR